MNFFDDFFARRFWANLFGLHGIDRDIFFALSYQTARKQRQRKVAVKRKVEPRKEVVDDRTPDAIIRYEEGSFAKALVMAADYVFDPKNNASSVGLEKKT